MSRYTKKIGKIEYAWGYDRPLSQYFFDKFNSDLISDENEEGAEFEISSNFSIKPLSRYKTKYSNGEILEVMEKEMKIQGERFINEDHLKLLALDLPF